MDHRLTRLNKVRADHERLTTRWAFAVNSRPTTVHHTDRPPLCATRWSWSGHGTSTVDKCCQQETDDRRLFITLRVQLCVPLDKRDGARRANPSAAADNCTIGRFKLQFHFHSYLINATKHIRLSWSTLYMCGSLHLANMISRIIYANAKKFCKIFASLCNILKILFYMCTQLHQYKLQEHYDTIK